METIYDTTSLGLLMLDDIWSNVNRALALTGTASGGSLFGTRNVDFRRFCISASLSVVYVFLGV